jgi:hypothetical protein
MSSCLCVTNCDLRVCGLAGLALDWEPDQYHVRRKEWDAQDGFRLVRVDAAPVCQIIFSWRRRNATWEATCCFRSRKRLPWSFRAFGQCHLRTGRSRLPRGQSRTGWEACGLPSNVSATCPLFTQFRTIWTGARFSRLAPSERGVGAAATCGSKRAVKAIVR